SRRGGRPMTMQMVSTPLVNGGGDVTGCRTTLTDISAVKHAQNVLSFLARASALLSSSFDYVANVAAVVRDAVPLLADVCIADVRDPAHGLTRIELADAKRDRQRLARAARLQTPLPSAGSGLAAALELRRPILIRDYRPLAAGGDGSGLTHEGFVRACSPRSIMYVPMVMRGEALGVLTLVAAESGRQFAGPDLSTGEDLANRVAMAIENARLYDDAQRAVRAREQVLSFVSHDLKNPLMGILLSVDMLLSGAAGGSSWNGSGAAFSRCGTWSKICWTWPASTPAAWPSRWPMRTWPRSSRTSSSSCGPSRATRGSSCAAIWGTSCSASAATAIASCRFCTTWWGTPSSSRRAPARS